MFPCTGRSTCKSPAAQVNEMVDHMKSNKMKIDTLWLDVEVDPQSNNWPSASQAQSGTLIFVMTLLCYMIAHPL